MYQLSETTSETNLGQPDALIAHAAVTTVTFLGFDFTVSRTDHKTPYLKAFFSLPRYRNRRENREQNRAVLQLNTEGTSHDTKLG
jgi:hypothetical protein